MNIFGMIKLLMALTLITIVTPAFASEDQAKAYFDKANAIS